MKSVAVSVPKRGYEEHKNEDSYAVDDGRGLWVVADGATESVYSAEWAGILTRTFIERPCFKSTPLDEWLGPLRSRWHLDVRSRPMPWFAEDKIKLEGSDSTLLGVVAKKPKRWKTSKRPCRWSAVAVGDTCVFQVSSGELVASHPLKKSCQFDNTPPLLNTNDPRAVDASRDAVWVHGAVWKPGDVLLLMTDALAEWFLKRTEVRAKPWDDLEDLVLGENPKDVFAAWVDERRDAKELRDDDTTLVLIRFETT